MATTVVSETVRYGGPQRVLYSGNRLMRCDWTPPSPCYTSHIHLQWRHDVATDDWHDEGPQGVAGYAADGEDSYVTAAQRVMAGFARPHRLDRSYVMGRGPAAISWALDARPGVITVECMSDGRTYEPPPARLTIEQARAAIAYLTTPDPSRGWWGVDAVALRVGQHVRGHGIAYFGGRQVRITAAEWAHVLSEGVAALEASS